MVGRTPCKCCRKQLFPDIGLMLDILISSSGHVWCCIAILHAGPICMPALPPMHGHQFYQDEVVWCQIQRDKLESGRSFLSSMSLASWPSWAHVVSGALIWPKGPDPDSSQLWQAGTIAAYF